MFEDDTPANELMSTDEILYSTSDGKSDIIAWIQR
jgi:hypothetical protein